MLRRPLLIGLVATLVALVVGGATLTTAAPPTPSPPNEVGQLKIEGLAGEGSVEGFEGALPIRSFDFHIVNAGGGGGGGGGAGKAVVRTMDVVANIDKASPGLLKRLVQGTHIKTVTISLIRTGQEQFFVYKTYTLGDVTIDSLREYASGHQGDIPSVELSFKFRRLKSLYRREGKGGDAVETTQFCFNFATNNQCPT